MSNVTAGSIMLEHDGDALAVLHRGDRVTIRLGDKEVRATVRSRRRIVRMGALAYRIRLDPDTPSTE